MQGPLYFMKQYLYTILISNSHHKINIFFFSSTGRQNKQYYQVQTSPKSYFYLSSQNIIWNRQLQQYTYYEDSVHLNSKGYQTIFQALQPFLYSNRLSTPITMSMIWELARQSSLANHHHRRHQLRHLHHHHMPHHQLHHLHLHLHTVSMSSFHFTHHHFHHSLIQLHL